MEVRTQAAVNGGVGGAATISFGPNVCKEDGRREEDGHSDTGKGEGEAERRGRGRGRWGPAWERPRAVESSPPGRLEPAPSCRLRPWPEAPLQ